MDKLIHNISSNIKRVRLSKHLTQFEVAKKAAISTNHYAKIERGEVEPTLSTLERIVKSLKIKSSDILPF